MKTRPLVPKITSYTYKLLFGKYKGRTIEEVIMLDPGYILWMHDEKRATFDKKILDAADEADTNDRFSEAMDGELQGMRFWDIYNDI